MSEQPLTTPAHAPISNPTIDIQLRHRTIRSFTDEPLTTDQLATLYEVARRGASCNYAQQYTIIRVTDPTIRDEIYRSSGQPYVGGRKGELFVFIADLYRNSMIRREAGKDILASRRVNLFFSAFCDVMIAAQNMVIAAESMGLGTVYLASIQAEPERVVKALKLPKYTYPVVGMLIGYPNQDPQYKPRLPTSITVAENTYPVIESYKEVLAEYDELVQEYYDLRDANNRVDSFTDQIIKNFGEGLAMKSPMFELLRFQGLLYE